MVIILIDIEVDEKKLIIRTAEKKDFDQIWPIIEEIVREGKTYEYPVDMSKEEAYHVWVEKTKQVYLAEIDGEVLATYYIKTNHSGQGSHVCNCGYMVSSKARGKGLGTVLCEHSQKEAIKLGFRAMQFNFVASTNLKAVSLWLKLGYKIVGRLPEAFNHPDLGFVDAYVMYKILKA
ncbi:GNAT family N-acetyltransferase [Natronospora cellulosivora (SeqCode)]